MTMRDLLEYGEKCLREDNEYWEQMDKFRADIDKLINRHNTIMAATIVRLALALLTEQSCTCADCTGGHCEDDYMEALDALDSVLDDMLDEALNEE